MNIVYLLFAFILAIVSPFTGEVVTFIMLGFILMALTQHSSGTEGHITEAGQ